MNYKVGMISLGCPKNQVDGEIMLKKLNDNGFDIVNDIENADLVIVNTCGFIEDAKKEAIESIFEAVEYKNKGIIRAIVVTGCLAERYQEEILKEIPEVDAVIGIGANSDIVKVCQKALGGITTSFYPDKCYLPLDDERMVSTPSHWAYVKISDGCSNRCSYCAIPYIRGGFRSRKIESIVNEVKDLAKSGVKEIILIAQDTTKYGFDIYKKYALVDLLKELVKVDGIKWIRMLYCYPDLINDELINLIASEDKLCNYLDIPLQHANGDILKSMNRFGDSKSLTILINKIRKAIPDIAIRTTFMVGFPGETEKQFEELCVFNKECKFDRMGCFTYSPEEDTPAATFDNQIEENIKTRRAEVLMNEQYDISERINNDKVGKTFKVITDYFDNDKNLYVGRTYRDAPEIDGVVLFSSKAKLNNGDFVNVKIDKNDGYDLYGRTID